MLNYIKNNKGFTFTELIIVIGFVLSISLIGAGIYVAFHFVTKFW
jgi:Tfp pilus assembly protein PilE